MDRKTIHLMRDTLAQLKKPKIKKVAEKVIEVGGKLDDKLRGEMVSKFMKGSK